MRDGVFVELQVTSYFWNTLCDILKLSHCRLEVDCMPLSPMEHVDKRSLEEVDISEVSKVINELV